MKALKRFYGKSGRWYDIGDEIKDEDQKYVLKGFVTEEKKIEAKSPDKVVAKTTTKRKRKPKEDKNGKPKTDNK
jgi:hypothetical protein